MLEKPCSKGSEEKAFWLLYNHMRQLRAKLQVSFSFLYWNMNWSLVIFKIPTVISFMVYICISSSSSSLSCRNARTDLPDPLSPLVSIVHRSREMIPATSCIGTELLYIGSSWSYLCSSIWRGPHEYIAYEFVLTSSEVSRMSVSSNLDSFCDG